MKITQTLVNIVGFILLLVIVFFVVSAVAERIAAQQRYDAAPDPVVSPDRIVPGYRCDPNSKQIPPLEYPYLFFGQEVTLTDEFFRGIKAVVVDRLGSGFNIVTPLEGPVVRTVRIHSRITLPVPVTEVIFTEGQWVTRERETND